MCTVSFIPSKNKILLTSNRDEKQWRLAAVVPMKYSCNSCEMIFPKDSAAGGSWISLCNNGNAGVLLNGAFNNHAKKENYLKSRGLIFLEIMDAYSPVQKFLTISLSGIEPFTLVIWQQNVLYECRWDDKLTKHFTQLYQDCAYIWSSATLYDKEMRTKKENWFSEWLNQHPEPSADEILKFHGLNRVDDEHNVLNSEEKFLTVSITIMELTSNYGNMNHTDFVTGKTKETTLHFK